MEQSTLYPLQEVVLSRLQGMGDAQFDASKLCGGTALSRCWLDHRMSYDLDFFLPLGFKVTDLAVAMKQSGINFETQDIVDDIDKANQLHGYVVHEKQRLKVSFIEDAYFELFPAINKPFGQLMVRTEEIPGLYHRKLRTVAGHGRDNEPDSFAGGRQKSRDLFDLYVLSMKHMPIQAFMQSLPYPFPSGSFTNGLLNMPWFDLIFELDELVCAPEWKQAKDVEFLQNALHAQVGVSSVCDDTDSKTESSGGG